MIKSLLPVVAAWFALATPCAIAADAGIYTIVESDIRVLRGTAWFRLAPGTRVQEGDIFDAPTEYAQLQLEWAAGGTVNVHGPALGYVASVFAADNKSAATDLVVQRGWLKAAMPAGRPLRLRLPAATVDLADAIVVVRGDPGQFELFVESGTAKVSVPVARGKPPPPRDVPTGEFASRAGDRALGAASRPPQAFLSAMPRQFRDALAALGSHFPEAPELGAGREVTLAEAEPWLAGTSRRTFVKRFTPRLGDPAFRAAVAARGAAFPEWDRILHPEKYRPKETSDVK